MKELNDSQQLESSIELGKEQIAPSSIPTSTPADANTTGTSKTIIIGVIIIFLVMIFGIGGFFLFSQRKALSSGDQVKTTPDQLLQNQKTPHEKLATAVEKTIDANTLYLEYKTKVTSRVSSAQTGVTKTLNGHVDGYMTGSTDGKVGKMEFRIYSDLDPSKSVNMSVLNTEDGSWYLKTAATTPKWQKFTKKQYDKLDEEQPADASLYGTNMLATIFSEDKALLKSFNKDLIENLGEEIIDGKSYSKYRIEISTSSFIDALSYNEEVTAGEVEDVSVILKNAVITTTFFVDNDTNYIKRIKILAKNLTQIPTPESQQLGLSTVHDIDLTADLSRFNLPTEITSPDPTEIVESSTNI